MKTFILWSVLLAFSGPRLTAQQTKSGVQGTVTLGGAAFPAVEVEASSSSIGQFWETSTDSAGRYLLNELPPGRYTVWVEASGYGCIVKSGVVIKAGTLSTQSFRFSKNKRYPGCESLKPRKRQ